MAFLCVDSLEYTAKVNIVFYEIHSKETFENQCYLLVAVHNCCVSKLACYYFNDIFMCRLQ